MIIGTAVIRLRAPWARSLKDKRMIVASIVAKVGSKFNVSIAETEDQDQHKSIVLGVACVAANNALADSTIEKVINYIEDNTDAEIMEVLRENF
ncbi:MAG: DUF503 domain-containing protein [Clostridiales bacterium]|nr:DUF503 domain-containing protein [Clostridiales bacterium]